MNVNYFDKTDNDGINDGTHLNKEDIEMYENQMFNGEITTGKEFMRLDNVVYISPILTVINFHFCRYFALNKVETMC